MEELIRVENKIEDSVVQYDIVPCDTDVDMSIDVLQGKIDEINAEIEKYTNNADWLDDTITQKVDQ